MVDSVQLAFDIDESFRPFGDSSDVKVYLAVSDCCDTIDPLTAQGLGYSVMRWLYLHAVYRLPRGLSTVLRVPAHVLSLACGFVVFMSVYGKTHALDSDGLVLGCSEWLQTVRDAHAKARSLRSDPGQVMS
jgi:hypothetical protein